VGLRRNPGHCKMKRMNKYLGFPSGFAVLRFRLIAGLIASSIWRREPTGSLRKTRNQTEAGGRTIWIWRCQHQSVEIEGGIPLLADDQLRATVEICPVRFVCHGCSTFSEWLPLISSQNEIWSVNSQKAAMTLVLASMIHKLVNDFLMSSNIFETHSIAFFPETDRNKDEN
jgi:hypothetical protein